ncbi:MAG: PIN domain-containing protein [Actinomycetia bacterium]|nr:PIN domain-containing protein [Actinomycetes bacterium]
MPDARRAFLDTNVYLTATDPKRARHRSALFALEQWPSRGVRTYTSTQVLREYLVVATRPTTANGLGLSPDEALANVEEFEKATEVLPDTLKSWDKLRALLAESKLTGVRIHDANIAACALANGIDTVLTANSADFHRLPILTINLESLNPDGP